MLLDDIVTCLADLSLVEKAFLSRVTILKQDKLLLDFFLAGEIFGPLNLSKTELVQIVQNIGAKDNQ